MFPHFPYTNFHALNLDWIIAKIRLAIMSINGNTPDENGNVTITPEDVNAVATVNGIAPDANGNVDVGTVKSVNNITPNTAGNVDVGTVKSVNGSLPDSNGNVNLPTVAGVTSVCGVGADSQGNVTINATNVGAVAKVNNISPDNTGNVTIAVKDTDPHNVKYYGAVGDGVTDDTTAFQTALTAVGNVYVPTGEYIISNLTLPGNGSIIGMGPGSILKMSGTITIDSWYATIQDLRIIKNKPQGDTSFAIVSQYPYTKINNVIIDGFGRGVQFGGASSIMSNCFVEAEDQALICIGGDQSLEISDCTFKERGTAHSGTGIILDDGNIATSFINCSVLLFRMSVRINNGCMSERFVNCFFDSAAFCNIAGAGSVSDVSFDSCWFSANDFEFYIGHSFNGLLIHDCVMYSTAGSGFIVLSDEENPITASNFVISGSALMVPNVFNNTETGNCQNWIISNNIFGNYRGWTESTGYVFGGDDTTWSNALIIGNSFVGRSNIVFGSQPNKTFVNNMGYTP